MKIVFGLGNPGVEYANTRHNAGFLFADALREKLKGEEWTYVDKFKSESSCAYYQKEKILLFKPQTFMNLSGFAFEKVYTFLKPEEEDVMVVYDDIDLKIGSFRLKKNGSSGGHNGMKSILEFLQSRGRNTPRLRIGIDSQSIAEYDLDLSRYVLHKFSPDERKLVDSAINKAVECYLFSMDNGISAAMQAYN